jgi:hypothetical protein
MWPCLAVCRLCSQICQPLSDVTRHGFVKGCYLGVALVLCMNEAGVPPDFLHSFHHLMVIKASGKLGHCEYLHGSDIVRDYERITLKNLFWRN